MANTNKKGPVYYNEEVYQLYLSAGLIPPKYSTSKPLDNVIACWREGLYNALKIIDEQDAVNRYIFEDLPIDLSPQEIERLIYFKGQLAFFFDDNTQKFYLMPYALNGTIDYYGRFNTVRPVPLASGQDENVMGEAAKKLYEQQKNILSSLSLTVVKDVPEGQIDSKNKCVLLHDYTKGLSQTIIARNLIQDPIIQIEADCLPFMRTALINGTGIKSMRVQNEDEQSNVQALNSQIYDAALKGKGFLAAVGSIDMQQLTSGPISKAEEYLLAMQSIDNFRKSTYGLENGGLYEKKQYQNLEQTAMNGDGEGGTPLIDGLKIRQKFCDIVNAVWGLNVSVRLAERPNESNILERLSGADGEATAGEIEEGGEDNADN